MRSLVKRYMRITLRLMGIIGREFLGGYVDSCGSDCMQHYR